MKRWRYAVLVLAVALLAAGVAVGYGARPEGLTHVVPVTADEWTALATWITAVIAGVAAWVGLRQAAEARALRIEQAQPYVVATMSPSNHDPLVIEFALRNIGATPARHITVDVTPRVRAIRNDEVRELGVPTELPYLAPGQEWRTVWDVAPTRLRHPALQHELRHEVIVRFDGVDGTPRQQSEAVLDWEPLRHQGFLRPKTLDHIEAVLLAIQGTLGSWTRNPGGGLAAFTYDGPRADTDWQQRFDERWAPAREELGDLLDDPSQSPVPSPSQTAERRGAGRRLVAVMRGALRRAARRT